MLKPFDMAARSLLIVGGLNYLSIAAGKVDFIGEAVRARFGRPTIASRTIYGVVGGAALWSLARMIEQEAFPKSAGRKVRGAMTAEPASVSPQTTAAEAARMLQREDVGSLPVVEGGTLVGVVTDRDLALRVVGESRDPGSVTVGEIASHDLVTVRPDQALDEALRLMAREQVRRLPVVEDGRLVGILAQADVARSAPDRRAGAVVEDISK